MTKIAVISPHYDDAAFSVALLLRRLAQNNLDVTVVNCFTRSVYAPYSGHRSLAEISRLRRREDRRSLKKISGRIRVIDLGLLDAPLRLGLPFDRLMVPESVDSVSPEHVSDLSRTLRSVVGSKLVVAPLALGFHVDHQMVHRASLLAFPHHRLGFYEDLPYAIWTLQETIEARVRALSKDLTALYAKTDRAIGTKGWIASTYQSQITVGDAKSIGGFARTYQGSERLWIPALKPSWSKIRQLSREPQRTATPRRPMP